MTRRAIRAGAAGLVVVTLLLAQAACTGTRAPEPTGGAPRLVSLAPPITETLGAVGATDMLVGRSDWCTLPAGIEALPALGSALTPDLERIARVRPTRILVDGSAGIPVADLGAVAPVEILPWLTLADVTGSVRRLGALTHHVDAAEALVAAFAPLAAVPGPEAPSVLLVIGGEGMQGGEIWYIKRNSLHGGALHAAGGRNAVDHDVSSAPVLSLEGVIELDPPIVIVLSLAPVTPEVRARIEADWGRLAPLVAVKRGRIGVVGGPTVMATGPAILDTVSALRAELARLATR